MLPLLLTIALFAGWSLVGYAVLAAVRADLGSLRVCLTAPALGVGVVTLATFALAQAGLTVGEFDVALTVVVGVAAVAALAWRRPGLPPAAGVLGVLAACLAALLVLDGPMREFGFGWLANTNDDMANVVFGATRMLDRGYSASLDIGALATGVDYSESYKSFFASGIRVGSDSLVALVSGISGRGPLETFMPTIVALHLVGICAAGALALQATRRWWAAVVAAFIVALAPMATYGVLQQLIAQVFGLALGAALMALLMRDEVHSGRGLRWSEIVPIALLAAAVAFTYPEMGAILAVGYALWLAIAVLGRRIELAATLRLLLAAAAIAVVALGPWASNLIGYVRNQAQAGAAQEGDVAISLFSFVLLPTALPGAVGIQTLVPPPIFAPSLDLSIVLATIVLAAVVALFVAGTRRGAAGATIGTAVTVLAIFLAVREADFGLFKLTMFVLPFAAAAVAAWMARPGRWHLAAAIPLVLLVPAWLSTQESYVEASRQPSEMRNASAPDQIPAVRSALADARGPTVSAADSRVMQKYQATLLRGQQLRFISDNPVADLIVAYDPGEEVKRDFAREARLDGWTRRRFRVASARSPVSFLHAHAVTDALRDPACELVVPGPTQNVFNRRGETGSNPNFRVEPCTAAEDTLAFVNSNLGQHFYLGERNAISYYSLETDPYRPGGTFSGFGRYALFRIVGPTPGARLAIDLTAGLSQDGDNRLPPVRVVGASTTALPIVGRGAARVYSRPVRPLMIGGAAYVLVDMGRPGRLAGRSLTGVAGAYGKDLVADNRLLTALVRDLSLVPARELRASRPPSKIDDVPAALADPRLQFSGIYDDGWLGERSYVVLSADPGDTVEVAGEVPSGLPGQRLTVLVDGKPVASRSLAAGRFSLGVPVPRAGGRRRIELRFSKVVTLQPPDSRPAAARLFAVGFTTLMREARR